MKVQRFNVTCLAGHVFTVTKGHPLYEKCVKRLAAGFLDAMTIQNDPENCPDCADEEERRKHREALYMDW